MNNLCETINWFTVVLELIWNQNQPLIYKLELTSKSESSCVGIWDQATVSGIFTRNPRNHPHDCMAIPVLSLFLLNVPDGVVVVHETFQYYGINGRVVEVGTACGHGK